MGMGTHNPSNDERIDISERHQIPIKTCEHVSPLGTPNSILIREWVN